MSGAGPRPDWDVDPGSPDPGAGRPGTGPASGAAPGSAPGAASTGTAVRPDRVLRALPAGLRAADREVLGWWLVSRLGFLTVLLMVPAVFTALNARPGSSPSIGQALVRWDAVHFQAVAAGGYTPGVPGAQQPTGVPLEAFFPGFPALAALLELTGIPFAAAGVVIGLAFGGVGAWALGRIAALEPGSEEDPGRSGRAALLWIAAPLAIFVAVPYSEAPFVGLAFPAWLAARNRRWAVACLLAAGASACRISGLYLAAALVVQYLVVQLGERDRARRRRDWRLVPLFVVPVLPVVGYFGYLWSASGNPRLWFDVQAQYWYRTFTWPWTSLHTTWVNAVDHLQAPDYAWMFGAELVAFAVGVLLTVLLLVRRRWAEAVFVALQLGSYATSYWLMSVPRATLIWWPLWTMAAAALARRRWLLRGWLTVSVCLAAVWAAAYLTSQWAG